MKRPSPPPPPKPLRLRRWLYPLIAVMVVVALFRERAFDGEALAADFAAGRVEAALQRLADTGGAGLPPSLSDLEWWPVDARAPRLARLLAIPEENLLESPDDPTFVSPLGTYREEPAAARLREAHAAPLVFELTHIGLGLLAMHAVVPAGEIEIPFDVGLLPGADYQIALREVGPDGADGPITALARFRWTPGEEARAVGLAMAEAHDLALPSHEGSALLAAIAAFGHGCTGEAIARLTELEDAPEYAKIARELHALALDRQGLDWSARRLLQR